MSTGLGLPGERQDRGGEGEHTVSLQGGAHSRQSCGVWVSPLLSSPRTLCDNLRRERDRAVSDLADALRNLDDMRKQKNDALRELKEIK